MAEDIDRIQPVVAAQYLSHRDQTVLQLTDDVNFDFRGALPQCILQPGDRTIHERHT